MDVLTLGRYILEMSLMDYKYTQMSDSKVAAAALLLAVTMKKTHTWVRSSVIFIHSTISMVVDIPGPSRFLIFTDIFGFFLRIY